MNRESLPLIAGFLIPIILVSFILLYYYGYEYIEKIINFFLGLNIMYYFIIIPFVLGFVVIIVKYLRPN